MWLITIQVRTGGGVGDKNKMVVESCEEGWEKVAKRA